MSQRRVIVISDEALARRLSRDHTMAVASIDEVEPAPIADVVVVGAGVDDPIRVLQRVHQTGNSAPVVVVSRKSDELRERIRLTPLLPADVSFVAPQDAQHAVVGAMQRGAIRRRHAQVTDQMGRQLIALPELPVVRSLQFLDDLLARSPLGVLLADASGMVLIANQAAAALLHREVANIVGSTLAALDPAVAAVQPNEERADSRGEQGRVELTGGLVVELTAWRLQEGTTSLTAILLNDVTELAASERGLQAALDAVAQSESRFRSIFLRAPTGLAVVDRDGTIEQANAALEHLTGVTMWELEGQRVPDLFPGHRDEVLQALHGVTRGDVAELRGEWRLAVEDHPPRWVTVTIAGLGEGPRRRPLVQFSDTTDHHEAEAMLTDAYRREREVADRLREVDNVKDGLIAAVSHELRTPIAVTKGMSETLIAHADRLSPERVTEFLRSIHLNAERLEHLVTDLLDLDRIKQGILLPDVRTADVAALVADAVATHAPAAHALTVTVDPRAASALVDPTWLERIVVNLLTNAGRYTASGTPLHLRVERDGRDILVVLADHGAGIADSDKEAMFERFRQGARGSSAGVGIGLALVRQFAELHDGGAWVEDTPGGGATFLVRLREPL